MAPRRSLGTRETLPTTTRWEKLARAAVREELNQAQRAIAGEVLNASSSDTTDAAIQAWARQRQDSLEQYRDRLAELRSGTSADLAMLSVAVRDLRGLAGEAGV